jgi:accessory gene regulator B
VILGLASALEKIAESLTLLAVILPLQSFGGGYHAKTHLRCFLIMLIGWWAVIIILPFISPAAAIVMTCAGVLIVYKLAPIAHENVKMSNRQRFKMRKIVRIVVTVGAMLSFFLLFSTYDGIGVAMSTGLGVI